MKPATDEEIVGYFRAGYEEVAFRLLVEVHGKKVYNIALFMLNDEIVAEDVTQDVYIKIYKGLRKFRGEAKLSTWIYRIVKNVCFDYLTKIDRNQVNSLDESHNLERFIDDSKSPETEYMNKWRRRIIRNAVWNLPKNQRLAITLFYFHEKSYEQIANIMDIPMGTVKSHLNRAKRQLTQLLSKYDWRSV